MAFIRTMFVAAIMSMLVVAIMSMLVVAIMSMLVVSIRSMLMVASHARAREACASKTTLDKSAARSQAQISTLEHIPKYKLLLGTAAGLECDVSQPGPTVEDTLEPHQKIQNLH